MKVVFNPLTGEFNLTAESSGASVSYPITPDKGGTGIANAAGSTLTLGAATTITGGGTVALGGFTLTVPATLTVAGLGIANVFTAAQKINVNSTTALLVEQDGVKDNVLIADTTNGRVGINCAPNNLLSIGLAASTSLVNVMGNTGVNISYPATLLLGMENTSASSAGQGAGFVVYSNDGAALASGDRLGFMLFGGSISSTSLINSAGVVAYAENTWSGSSAPSKLEFQTTAVGGTTRRTVVTVASTGNVLINGFTTTTNAVFEAMRLQAVVSTAATGSANGFGAALSWYAETAIDGTNQQQGAINTSWIDATNATRKAKLSLYAYDTAARLGLEIEASGSAAKLAFYGGTTVVRGAALTTQLTTITHTSPGTPDYAIQDLTNVAPFGFVSQDEGNTVLSVIRNLQIRVAELEARLGSATGVNLFA